MTEVRVQISGDSMWPAFPSGSLFRLVPCSSEQLSIGHVVLARHPFHSDVQIVKRIQHITKDSVFLVGDNPDPLASEDSHNFGSVSMENILGRVELVEHEGWRA